MDVPAGKLGTQLNSFIASKTGAKTDPNGTIPVTIGLGGTVTNPTPKLLMDEQKEQVKDAVVATAKEEGAKAVEKAVEGTDAEKIVKDILGTSKDTTAASTSDTTTTTTEEDVQKKLEDEAKKKIQNLLKKKS
jgi:hypothetical protein